MADSPDTYSDPYLKAWTQGPATGTVEQLILLNVPQGVEVALCRPAPWSQTAEVTIPRGAIQLQSPPCFRPKRGRSLGQCSVNAGQQLSFVA